MGTIVYLNQPIRRRAIGHAMGRPYMVALLPGDVIELRPAYARRSYKVPLRTLLECLANLDAEEPSSLVMQVQHECGDGFSRLAALNEAFALEILVGSLMSEPTGQWKRVYALGIPADPRRGVLAVAVTPWFESALGLSAHCDAHHAEIMAAGAPR